MTPSYQNPAGVTDSPNISGFKTPLTVSAIAAVLKLLLVQTKARIQKKIYPKIPVNYNISKF
jgi:hypothetical protein